MKRISLILVVMLILTSVSISIYAEPPTLVLPVGNIDTATLTGTGMLKTNSTKLSVDPANFSSLTIPASYEIGGTTYNVTGIADSGFSSKGSIKVPVIIPEGVTSIGASAFKGCNLVTGFTIPSTVTTIGDSAFQQDTAVSSFTNYSPSFKVEGNALYTADGKELVAYAMSVADDTFVVPEGVEKIRAGAIRGSANLVTIEYPKTLKTIATSGTYACTKLDNIKFKSSTAPAIDNVNFNQSAPQSSKRAFTVYYPANGTGYTAESFTLLFIGNSLDINAPATYIPVSSGEPTCPISSVTATTTGYDVSFAVPTVADDSPYIIVALYDNANHLVGVSDTITNTNTSVSINVSDKNAVTAKLMVWNDENEIKPLVDVMPFTVN